MKTKGGNNNSLNNQKTKGPNQGTHRVGGTAMARPNQGKTGGQTPSEESDTRKMDKAENTADSRAREVGHGGKVTMENSNEVLESLWEAIQELLIYKNTTLIVQYCKTTHLGYVAHVHL